MYRWRITQEAREAMLRGQTNLLAPHDLWVTVRKAENGAAVLVVLVRDETGQTLATLDPITVFENGSVTLMGLRAQLDVTVTFGE